MEITGLNKYCHTDTVSKNVGTKYNGGTEINMAEVFRNEVLKWEEKIKKKINEDLENDRECNNNMSEKKWSAFMNGVDRALNVFDQNGNTDIKAKDSRPDKESKRLHDDSFARYQISVQQRSDK
ncbi:hypothetical protein BXY41_102173 [Lacrimispora xylanisolvens]|uniref:Uncharacterized protein n=1 Tax=Lacrimispora xylanisolvens TaxID=384636 RepID=A0A2S6HX31_9FIRM|nr:hypothetical protein [Hungatella xylanolytica]PPK82485.1 hypothetical protein BXY41_102173 [Hungatella xylanolytica]